jgi:hypothetical protein
MRRCTPSKPRRIGGLVWASATPSTLPSRQGRRWTRFLNCWEIVPTTLAGVVVLVAYLDELNKQDPWKFEDNYATPLIGNLAKAFDHIGGQS